MNPSLEKQALIAVRRMQARLEEYERRAGEPIAIVGMCCRFPGANDIEEYWRLLREGRDAIREVPPERWSASRYYDPDPDAPLKMNTRWGGFLDDVAGFDPPFFGVSPPEAAAMDPQQRLFLEVAWEAMENAAITPGTLAGGDAGVFAGVCMQDYERMLCAQPERLGVFSAPGSAGSIVANRLSFLLDLRGPSLAIDTACSSSLVALHYACAALRAGECSTAFAGGVNLILKPETSIAFAKARLLAADGRCKTFDASADGYVRGEGCGVVVLKRLSDATAGGDRILALVRGAAINQDGRSAALTAPNIAAQEDVIRAALKRAGVKPEEIGYIEAHGTGTALGDPIEMEALASVLGRTEAAGGRCAVGSVKTNFGHLEGAAGIAGLIKVVLILRHEEIPPHLHLRRLNPNISLEGTSFVVPTAALPWKKADRPRRAGVSSFGFGGTNAHAILEESPALARAPVAPDRPAHVLALSARSRQALAAVVQRYCRRLESCVEAEVADLCFTANTGRAVFPFRMAVRGSRASELARRLREHAIPQTAAPVLPETVFLFSGQGAQYAGMGAELFGSQAVFRQTLERCDALLRRQMPSPLLDVLFGSSPELLDETAFTQPALFALEWALWNMWTSWGVKPAAVAGHSVGEFAAACAAGVMTWEDGLRLTAKRGALMQRLPAGGEMWAVEAGEADIAPVLGPGVELAAVNGPRHTVLSGAGEAVRAAADRLKRGGIRARRLAVGRAFHSALMEPMLADWEREVAQTHFQAPAVEWVSTVSGERVAAAGPDYWIEQVRRPVRFAAALRKLRERRSRLWLEVGPGATLSGLGREQEASEDAAAESVWLPTLRKSSGEWPQALDTLARLWENGAAVDWNQYDAPYGRRKTDAPTYPFERRRHWLEEPRRARSAAVYEPGWRTAEPLAPRQHRYTGEWLVLADSAGLGGRLAELLVSRGAMCGVIAPGERFDACSRRVLHCQALDAASLDQETACTTLLDAVRQQPERIWVVTRGARTVAGWPQDAQPGQAVVGGLAKTIALECPELWGGLIDTDDTAASLAAIADELAQPAGVAVALRRGVRYVPELRAAEIACGTAPDLSPKSTYLVTGGLGALGMEAADCLVQHGARRLLLAGRRGPSAAARARIAEWRARGIAVSVTRVDVGFRDEVERLVAQAPDLRGVIHAAGELDDGVVARLTWERMRRVLHGKALGAWRLHEATRGMPLDFFVMFSSAASLEGSPGQAGYAAANSYLDALADARRGLGLPAISISWGPWAAKGMAADAARRGAADFSDSIDVADGVEILGSLLGHPGPHVAVLPESMYRALAAAGTRAAESARVDNELSGLPPERRARAVRGLVERHARRLLGMDGGEPLESSRPLQEYGLNSLLATELRSALAAAMALRLPVDLLFQHATVDALSNCLGGLLGPPAAARTVAPVRSAPAREAIAIIGMSCRFPGAPSPEAFWDLLREGRCAIREVPREPGKRGAWRRQSRRLQRHRLRRQQRGRTALAFSALPRPQPVRGYRVLVFAGRGTSGVRKLAAGRIQPRARRRSEPDALAVSADRLLQIRDDVARRTL